MFDPGSIPAKLIYFSEKNIFFPEMALAAIIVNPSFTIGDYEREDIVFFSPVLEQDIIGNIYFKIFETYIFS